MLALILKSRAAQGESAREDVHQAQEQVEQARREIQDALRRTAEAHKHSGFWHQIGAVFKGDVGAICEVIASVAVVAATGGVGAAGVIAIAAAGLTVGSTVAQKLGLDPKICAGLSAGAALAGALVGNMANASEFCQALVEGSHLVEIGAKGVGQAADTVGNNYDAAAANDQADATAARGQQNTALLDFNLALEVLQKVARDTTHAESTTADIVKSQDDGRTALISRLGAA
jgi:hypothetical protein